MEYTAKVAAHIAAALEPGERVLAAAPLAPRGSMRSIAYGNARRHLAPGRAELRNFGVAYARQFVVALTDRRVLWFRTSLTGRPKTLVTAMHRGDIDDLVLGSGRVLGQRFGQLRFTHRDARRCSLEVARAHAALANEMVACFHGVTAG
jgi:hypothetical protein